MSIRLQFVLGQGWSSRAIAWFSAGGDRGFSHVDAVLADGCLLGARSDSVGGKPPGVQIRPDNYEKWYRRVRFELDATPAQEMEWRKFLYAQVGKPYDSAAIVGFAFGRAWEEAGAFDCSQLQTGALVESRLCHQPYLYDNQITPTTLAVVVTALGARELT